MKRAALHSLGCKVNSYETEAMQQMLEQAGYEIVPFHEKADLYVINTCSVTNVADRKSRQMIHRARKQNPEAVVVAAGCYVQTSSEQAEQDAAVDIVIGNNRKQELPELIKQFEAECRKEKDTAGAQKERHHGAEVADIIDINQPGQPYEELKVSHPADHTRAFLKVQDGCNQFCSYCIIPYARGRVRSRRPEDVVAETGELVKNGFQEIVLTGIHLSSYGVELGCTLLDLIRAVHEIPGVRRIRLGSLEPGIITEEFVKELSEMEKVCPHFHLSLQSGSDTVLKRMNRKYTAEEYFHKCELLREYYEHPAITTDIIVGFPGETEEDFEETMDVVRRVRYDSAFTFIYSKRTGTPAADMENQVPETIVKRRFDRLLKEVQAIAAEKAEALTGQVQEVLVESINHQDSSLVTGRLSNNSVVHLPGDADLVGRIVPVRLEECRGFYYYGKEIR